MRRRRPSPRRSRCARRSSRTLRRVEWMQRLLAALIDPAERLTTRAGTTTGSTVRAIIPADEGLTVANFAADSRHRIQTADDLGRQPDQIGDLRRRSLVFQPKVDYGSRVLVISGMPV